MYDYDLTIQWRDQDRQIKKLKMPRLTLSNAPPYIFRKSLDVGIFYSVI